MKIAIISDLHIGDAARAADFSTNSTNTSLIDNFIDGFKRKFSSTDYNCDALIIAGDITNKARKDEFELAEKRINDISSILKVPQERIYFTPGNHDSNWEMGATLANQGSLCKKEIRQQRYKFLNENGFFSSRISASKFGSFETEPYSVVWSDDKFFVLSFNSSANDSHDVKPHHGAIETEDYQNIRNQLDSMRVEMDGKVKILLTHHHPFNYHETTYKLPDYSIMKNSDSIIQIAEEYSFDFVVHGHKHIPRYKHFISNAQHPLNIICSGSFSSVLDRAYFDGVGNFFHIIEIHDTCKDSLIPMGVLKSWCFLVPHGWGEDSQLKHISHAEPFGTNKNRTEVKKFIKQYIEGKFSDVGYVRLSELMQEDASLQYYSQTALNMVISELSKEIGFTPFQNSEDMVFLKAGA